MIRPSTVGGLDKRSVTRYWQHFGNGTTGRMDNHKAGHRHEDKHERSLSPPSSPGKEHVVVVHHDLPRIPESRVSAPSSPRMHQAASSSDLSRAMQRRPSTSGMSMGSDGSKDYLAYMRATKQISQIARTAAPDYQLDKILDVDLSHRKINQGEKDMLIRAINLEKEGDVDSAIILYTRAGAHSKEQQISKMLLGNLHYRQKKFMAALNFYNFAIKILHAKNESVRILQDEFLSHYNRSVINFRLGNDEMGMQDIESAVKLDPTHIQAREVLSIARRRMGKFTQAIEEAVSLKTQRLEKIRLEKLQAKQAQHQQDEISSSRETSPSRSTGPGISRNNSPSRDGIVIPSNRIFSTQFGGFQLKIKEPSAKNGVREKIAEGKTMMRGEGVSIGQSTEGGFLKMFKLNNGLEMELFDDLFKRPSLLQHALLVEPSMRTVEQYQIIRDTLKLFPFLRSLPESLMQELGRIIEYRTLTGKEEIFGQNEESAAVCMLLHGHIQVRQDYPNTGLIGVTLGELGDFSTFGHIDNLFRKPRSTLLKAIEECLLPHYMKLQKLAVNSGVDSGAAENTRDDLSVDTMDDEDNEVYQRFTNEFKRMWDSELHSGDLDRAIMPGMFMTYTMTSACEFFFIPEREFNRVLLDTALEELKTRLRAIVSSGIFQQWSMEDIIRLSRMGQIKSYRRGEVILEQGKRPDFFCIILKGLCRVTKKPNRTEMLYQKLHAALEKADQHDLKYVFHNTVSRVVLVHKTEEDKKQKASSKDKGGKEKSSKDKSNKRSNKNGKNASNNTSSLQKMSDPAEMLRKFSTDIPYQVSPPTEAEKARQELQAEIDKLQGLIQKAHAQDAFDNREDRTTHSYGSKTDKSYCLVTSDHPSKVSELAGHLSGKVSEITTLQWPRIFGEACISDPENGISRGSIIADTYCEVFALHRSQIQTFPVDKEFIDRVKGKSIYVFIRHRYQSNAVSWYFALS